MSPECNIVAHVVGGAIVYEQDGVLKGVAVPLDGPSFTEGLVEGLSDPAIQFSDLFRGDNDEPPEEG